MFGFLEALPLPIFVLYVTVIDPGVPQDWLGPFIASSIVAILTTAFLLYSKALLNRLMIGINIYLLIGSFGG